MKLLSWEGEGREEEISDNTRRFIFREKDSSPFRGSWFAPRPDLHDPSFFYLFSHLYTLNIFQPLKLALSLFPFVLLHTDGREKEEEEEVFRRGLS